MTMKGGSIPQTTNFDHGLLVDRPINPAKGQIYAVTDKNRLDICYIDGKWNEGASIAEIYKDIQRLDKQVWNTETELNTFNLNQCIVVGDSVQMRDTSIFINYPSGSESAMSTTQPLGIRVTPKTDITDLLVTISNDITRLYVKDISYNTLWSATGLTGGSEVNIDYTLLNGVTYNIVADDTTSYVTWQGSGTFPIEDNYLKIEGGAWINQTLDTGLIANISNIRYNNFDVTKTSIISPSVTPANLAKWEYAYFEIDKAGETITADILDAANDSVLIENISDGESLHDISSDTNLKIRFNLSRADTANNPKVYNAILKWINVLT